MEKKSFLITEALCLLFGFLGIHRYYTGYIGLGILQTLTLGGLGIWSMIDFIFISTNKYRDAKGQELEDYNKNIGIGALIFVLVLAIFFMFSSRAGYSQTVERKVNFADAQCSVYANGYSCNGHLSPNDKLEIKKIQAELPPVTLNQRKVEFDNAKCSVYANGYSCNGHLSPDDKLKIKKIQAELQ